MAESENVEEEYEFQSYEEASNFIHDFENRTGSRFVKQKSRKDNICDITSLEGRRIAIGDKYLYVTLDSEIRECHHGRRRSKRRPITDKRRIRRQDTKKMDCPAKISVKTILLFPQYEINKNSLRKEKTEMLKKFRDHFLSNRPDPPERQLRVIVEIIGKHQKHEIGEAADFNLLLDVEIGDYIRQKMDEGIHNIDEMLSRIQDLNTVQGSRATNRRYNPSRKTVYNVMYNHRNSLRQSNDDLTNTKLYLERKAAMADSGNIFYRPAVCPDSNLEGVEDTNGLLIIYQSQFQAEILKKYSGEVALLDSTYNTCNFSVPLYMVAVQTNSGFVVVASFILGRDTKEQICEALQKIKNFNPRWNPKYFLTDYDTKEMGAVEAVFPEATHLLCHFHVIQAWKRWTQNNKELRKEEKSELLNLLRNICNSNSDEEYTERVEQLMETNMYKSNRKMQGWLETRWFSEKQRWVDWYREKMDLRSDTTNGLEVQHREFKRSFLQKQGIGGSVENVVKILIDKYLPKMEIRYKEINQRAKSTSKLYAAAVPDFLVNRPPILVEHCLKRMPPKIPEISRIKKHDTKSDTFNVKSGEAAEVYEVSFMNMIPRCTCPDFRKKHWPCKHLLAIVCSRKEYAWERLSKGYTEQNCFTLDDLCEKSKEIAEDQSTPDDHTYCFEDTSSTILTETSSIVQVRKKCLEEAQTLTNNMYCLDDIDVINNITERIREINAEIQTKIPTVQNLPLRRKKRTKNPSVSGLVKRKKRVNVKEDVTVIEEIVLDDFDVNTEDQKNQKKKSYTYKDTNISNAMLLKDFNGEDSDPNQKALKEILLDTPGEEVVMEVGPYKLTRQSFHCLKEELADEMIDAYLSLLLKGKNVHHLCCSTATDIFYSGQEMLHGYLRTERYGITELVGNWSISTLPHARQIGGSSCGVYALKFAECFTLKQPLVFQWDHKDVIVERMKIGTRLLGSATELFGKKDVEKATSSLRPILQEERPTLDGIGVNAEKEHDTGFSKRKHILKKRSIGCEYTPVAKKKSKQTFCICNKPDDGNQYWGCDKCDGWFHPSCVGEKKEPKSFICPSCKQKEDRFITVCGKPLFIEEFDKKMVNDFADDERQANKNYQPGELQSEVLKNKHGLHGLRQKQFMNTRSSFKNEKPGCRETQNESEEPNCNNEKCELYDIPAVLQDDEEDDEDTEETFFIDLKIANKLILKAVEAVKKFLKCPLSVKTGFLDLENIPLKGFGYAVFSTKALIYVEHVLKKVFLKITYPGAYSKLISIDGVTEEMKKKFHSDSSFADRYVHDVLLPEALVNILQAKASLKREHAVMYCKLVQSKSKIKATSDGINMSLSIKEELQKQSETQL